MTARSFVIAIDGPAASGKGTLARRLAERFGFAHLDTGALYRATALLVLERAGDPADPVTAARAAELVHPRLLSDPRLRGEAVSATASIVAAIPGVRRALLDLQRNFATHPPRPAKGAILDGRDIGSIVCPAAEVKLFVTASAEERARRRAEELRRQRRRSYIRKMSCRTLKERDARDSERRAAPLIAAPDATVIDTTTLDADTGLRARLQPYRTRAGCPALTARSPLPPQYRVHAAAPDRTAAVRSVSIPTG